MTEPRSARWTGGECPPYYRVELADGTVVTPFDIIEALELNFNLGCVTKYTLRAGRKGPKLEDLKKARNCLDREITRIEDAENVAVEEVFRSTPLLDDEDEDDAAANDLYVPPKGLHDVGAPSCGSVCIRLGATPTKLSSYTPIYVYSDG